MTGTDWDKFIEEQVAPEDQQAFAEFITDVAHEVEHAERSLARKLTGKEQTAIVSDSARRVDAGEPLDVPASFQRYWEERGGPPNLYDGRDRRRYMAEVARDHMEEPRPGAPDEPEDTPELVAARRDPNARRRVMAEVVEAHQAQDPEHPQPYTTDPAA